MDLHPSSADLRATLDRMRVSEPGVYRVMAWRHGTRADAATSVLVRAIEVDGGACFAPFVRTAGVNYAEVVRNIAGVLHILDLEAIADLTSLQTAIVNTVLEVYRCELSTRDTREWRALLDSAEHPTGPSAGSILNAKQGLTTAVVAPLLYGPSRAVARSLLSRAVSAFLRHWMAHQLGARRLSLAEPPADQALALWTLQDVASPAMFRVLPTVVELACYRIVEQDAAEALSPE